MPSHQDASPIVITGGTDGIGKALAYQLLPTNTPLLLIGRDSVKGQSVVDALKQIHPDASIRFWSYDLSLMKQVHALAQRITAELPPLQGIVHTAGVMLPQRTLTSEGLETVFAVQYVARFALTAALQGHLNPTSRIITVSAAGTIPLRLGWGNLQGEQFYSGIFALIHESVANDLWTLGFIPRNPDVLIYNYGPFLVNSSLFQSMPRGFRTITQLAAPLLGISPEAAAQDIFHLLSESHPSGLYRRHVKQTRPSRYLSNSDTQKRLFSLTQTLIKSAIK